MALYLKFNLSSACFLDGKILTCYDGSLLYYKGKEFNIYMLDVVLYCIGWCVGL